MAIRHHSDFRHYLVPRFLRMAAFSGFHLAEGSRVLDFGCGQGDEVYHWRDAGFDAYGFDLHDTPNLRHPDDAAFFRTARSSRADKADTRVDGADYRIDFDDGVFDFVFSMTVFEHVKDYDAAFRELARVMKPKSLGVHVFPGSYTLIEPHIGVPLASRIQNPWWFKLWARLGVRNEFQAEHSVDFVASENLRYAKQGLNYVRPADITAAAGRYFNEVAFAPQFWEYPAKRANLLFASHWARTAYTLSRDVVLVTARY
jgi:SAM-dependent methyltransferase